MNKLVALMLGLTAGCGEPDTDARLLTEVSDADAVALCEYYNAALPAGPVDCVIDGMAMMVDPALYRDAGCADATTADVPATCTATVAQFKDCADAFGGDLCSVVTVGLPELCAFLASAECSRDTMDP